MRRMSGPFDPYRPPASIDHGDRPPASGGDGAVSEVVLAALYETRPWAKFLGVLGFVGVGLMVLLGLGVMVAGFPSKAPGALGLFYMLAAALYVYPSLCLVRYGSAISRLLDVPDQETLAAALMQQKSFWRFMGIATVVVMVLYGVVIGIAVGIATTGR